MSADLFTSTTTEHTADEAPVKRDRFGRYLLPPVDDPGQGDKPWTRATTFCKSISDTFGLMQWSNRMIVKGLAARDDLYALAAATSLEDRDTLNRVAEDAKNAAGAKNAASLGTALHSFTEALDRGEEPAVPKQWTKDLDAYSDLVDAAGFEFPDWGIERIVTVERYGIAGTFDRIARLTRPMTVPLDGLGAVTLEAGDWVVVDVKTGKDLTYGFGDISIQLALYANADAMWNGSEGVYEELPPLRRDVALVIHLPAGKGNANLYGVNIARGWEAAELCEAVRRWRKQRNLAALVDLETGSWESRIAAAQSREDLSAIWAEAKTAGEWTNKLERMGKQRLADLVQ